MEFFDAELLAIGLAIGVTAKRREKLQQHGVEMVAVCSDSHAPI
jgi:hypothetical protein